VRVSSVGSLSGVRSLSVTVEADVSGNSLLSVPVVVPVAGSIPPAQTFALRFSASVDGPATVDVRALDAIGNTLAMARASARITPSESARVDVVLPAAAPPPPDMASGPPDLASPPCNPVTQVGCPSGQKCIITATCQPDGAQRIGDPCTTDSTGHSNCAAGGGCADENVCRQYCYTDSDCTQGPGPGSSLNTPYCVITVNGSSTKNCTLPCNPVLAAGSSGCAPGLECYYDFSSTGELTDCGRAGTVATGGSCATSDCAPNNNCVHGGTTMMDICRQNCRPGTAGDCPGGFNCEQFTRARLPFGFCCPSTGC
jgi:hypothetical protein